MRIIGGKDYYDGAGWGFDPTITFVRTPVEYHDHPFEDFWVRTSLRSGSDGIRFFHVVVGGKVIPAAAHGFEYYHKYSPYIPDFWYDVESIFKDYPQARWDSFYSFVSLETFRNRAIKHFTEDKSKYTEWLITNKVVVGHSSAVTITDFESQRRMHGVGTSRTGNRTTDSVFIANHDGLKDLKVQRVMPPAEAHEAVLRWVGGVLPNSKPIATISDKSKIVKAGFDLKSSFRKGKEK